MINISREKNKNQRYPKMF